MIGLLTIVPELQGCRSCQSENTINIAETDTGDGFINDWGSWLSMSAMPDGSPAIAYYDATAEGVGFAIADFDDDGTVKWTHEEVDGYPNEDGLDVGVRGKYAAMVITNDGTPWVVYQDVALGTLRYATRDAEGVWTSDVADVGGGSSPDSGYFASLALDENGAPIAVHWDKKQGNLRIVRWIAGVPTGEVLAEGEPYKPEDPDLEGADADVGQFAKIIIEGGIEYVAYYDAAFGDLMLSYGTPGNHTVEIIDADGDVGQWPDLLINDGVLHIAYHDVGNQDLKYAMGQPGDWSIDTVDTADYVGADADIFLFNNGPAIAYFDGQNNDMLLAQRGDKEWTVDVVTGGQGALGFHNETVFANDRHYIGCYDYTQRTLWFSTLD